jgi:hypothetical protein
MTDDNGDDLINLMISIMRSKRASTYIVERAANVIAAEARLNIRIGNAKTERRLGDRIFPLLDLWEAIFAECKVLARQFDDGDIDRDHMCEKLLQIANKLDQAV